MRACVSCSTVSARERRTELGAATRENTLDVPSGWSPTGVTAAAVVAAGGVQVGRRACSRIVPRHREPRHRLAVRVKLLLGPVAGNEAARDQSDRPGRCSRRGSSACQQRAARKQCTLLVLVMAMVLVLVLVLVRG